MKFKIAVTLGLICFVAVCVARPATEDEYVEYDEEAEAPPPPPPKPTPGRANPLLGRRNPLQRGPAAKSTTTTTAAPPAKEEEPEEVEEEIENEAPAEVSSTTETGRRITGNMVRPFRSNNDLLAALKRRREQAAISKGLAKSNPEPNESAPVAVSQPEPGSKFRASNNNGRRRFNKSEPTPAQDAQEPSSTAAPARTGRRFRN